jgi:hypothetical protein
MATVAAIMLNAVTEIPTENPMHRYLRLAAIVLPLMLPAAAHADEIADSMKEAMRAYDAGKFNEARTAMQEALQLLSQKAAAGLGAALPPPMPGWTAKDVETNTAALGMLGGGNMASRQYTNAQGQNVEITVAADSPIVAQLGVIMTNPMLAGTMGKLIRIGDQRAILSTNGEIQMLIENRILVTINGSGPEDAKLAYAKAIDTKKLISSGQ